MKPQMPNLRIGSIVLTSRVLAAPMAGVSDRPYRRIARSYGAALAVSEMVSSNSSLRHTRLSQRRVDHHHEPGPISVQLLGADPGEMADAARFNVDRGADIIDINMGCPAKKVCNRMVGSALLLDETLVGQILEAVVKAVDVPVTLKLRTGWDPQHRNGTQIARIAEAAGIQALAVHGRTRQCKYHGTVEYDTIRQIKSQASIPVIANGDIDTPAKARAVMDYTGADAVMIGRAAQGQPWLFRRISSFLKTGDDPGDPPSTDKRDTLVQHLGELYSLYGGALGARVARKHVTWYTSVMTNGQALRRSFNLIEKPDDQIEFITRNLSEPWAVTLPRCE